MYKAMAFQFIGIFLLTNNAREYIRLSLLATFAYFEGANEAGTALDKAAVESLSSVLSDSDKNRALELYSDMYTAWRDSGHEIQFLLNLLNRLVSAR